ncbi:MAG: hypothetical protein ACXVPL_07835 [Actinomycetota bacterium]
MRGGTGTAERAPRQGSGVIVEVVGPAAAGKTTLIRRLCSTDPRMRSSIPVSRVRSAAVMAAKAAAYVPAWLAGRPRDRWFTWRELKSLTFVDEWYREAMRGRIAGVPATFLDHGPLYRLAALRAFGPAMVRTPLFERWSAKAVARWRSAVGLIVWLDAPSGVLLQRAQHRGHWYLSADGAPEDKLGFLDRYRRALEEAVEGAERDGVRVVRLSTEGAPVEDLVERVRRALADLPAPRIASPEASSG